MAIPDSEADSAKLPEGFSSFLREPVAVADYGSSIDEGLFLLLSFKKQMTRGIEKGRVRRFDGDWVGYPSISMAGTHHPLPLLTPLLTTGD